MHRYSAPRQVVNSMANEIQKSTWRIALRFLPWLPLVIFAVLIGIQLLGPVPFGLADNNDFARVLGPLRLWPAPWSVDPAHPAFTYFVNDYVVSDPLYNTGVPSSEWLVAALAKKIAANCPR